jgi:integrase
LKKVLHQFLLTYYTGMRYQDLKNFSNEHIKGNFIVLKMHKTQKEVEIPLIDESKKLLPTDRKIDGQPIFNVYCNQAFNKYLKELAILAGIKKNISHHCARHTFATLALDNGMALEVISKILGHSSLKVTLIYARHTWATLASDLDSPKDVIVAALGHGATTTTDIYIDFDRKKVDIANRKVLDYVKNHVVVEE